MSLDSPSVWTVEPSSCHPMEHLMDYSRNR